MPALRALGPAKIAFKVPFSHFECIVGDGQFWHVDAPGPDVTLTVEKEHAILHMSV